MFPINPDPPEAPVQAPAVTLELLAAMPLGRLLSVAGEHDERYVSGPHREVLVALHKLDPQAAVRLLSDDITTSRVLARAAQVEMYGDFSGPLEPVAVETHAQAEGIAMGDAAAVVSADREIAQARHELAAPASDVPWLDGRTLSEAPRPWSDEDYQRDRRRAQAAELPELTRDRWAMSAEAGEDAVAELLEERMLSTVSELERKRVDALTAARARAARPAQEAQARAKAAAQSERDAEPAFGLYSGVAALPDGSPAKW